MVVIKGGKGTGKTKTLLEQATAANGIIVCEDPAAMRERAHRYGITGLEIVSYVDCAFKPYLKPLFIHDINKFLDTNYRNVQGYTLCVD